MKKLYTTLEYKLWQKRKADRIERKKRKIFLAIQRAKRRGKFKHIKRAHLTVNLKNTLYAPSDLRLIENTEECLKFFRNIRNDDYLNTYRNFRFVITSLKDVTQIDYGTISIITAISDDLKYKGIYMRVDFPENLETKQFMIDSGFLTHMVNEDGRPFPKSEKSDLILFEKGCGILSIQDNMKLSQMVKNIVFHLTGEQKHCLPVKTIILEICGNTIEWAGNDNQQWLFGVKYENEKVICTVTDVGKGILETLHRKFRKRMADIFTVKPNVEILEGAFNKKYDSNTQESNRNKGLPSVKSNFDQGTIQELKVLTNNVILHFDNNSKSRTFNLGSPRFKGTYYQWIMNNECLNNITEAKNEYN